MSHTIVLVHGAFAESASWDGVIDRLGTEHRVIAAEGLAAGFARAGELLVPETEEYLGTTVVVLRAP